MKTMKLFCLMTLAITVALCPQLAAQVQTDVPQAVPGAKPVSVEHIKVHGTALEGNLEGDAADRDVLDKYGIANSFEVYEGTHTSKVADRFQNHVIPFFSQNLCIQKDCT